MSSLRKSLLLLSLLATALQTSADQLSILLNAELDPYFWISQQNGTHTFGNSESKYLELPVEESLTFDTSNNRCLINQETGGAVQQMSFYEENRYVNHHLAGIWTQAQRLQSGKLAYAFEVDETPLALDDANGKLTTGFIDGSIPSTTFESEVITVQLYSFAPIEANGSSALRLGVYGAQVDNPRSEAITLEIEFPQSVLTARYMVNGELVEGRRHQFVVEAKGQLSLSTCIYPQGSEVDYRVYQGKGDAHWLSVTMHYFKRLTGSLVMPEDPFTASLFRRMQIECANAITLDAAQDVSVVNFGSYPAKGGVNIKDSIYPFYPLCATNPKLAQKGIEYLLEYAVRKPATKPAMRGDTEMWHEGGVAFSLGNTLGSIMLAGLYYGYTGDESFFTENPDLKVRMELLLDQVIETRELEDVWLFPSKYISDGYALGDYHTGSNVCAWFAFDSFARILDDVYGDAERAVYYREVATKVREAIFEYCVVDGPNGPMFTEGVDKDGEAPFLYHCGEETDTTLFSFYDFLSYDDELFRNYVDFAFTEANPGYDPETKAIVWQRYAEGPWKTTGGMKSRATFPSYITRLATTVDKDSMVGADGAMSIIRSMTDGNGAFWWWAFSPNMEAAELQRGIGHSGWATAVFVSLMQSDFLGVRYDAPSRTLRFRPFSPSSSFDWKGVRFGQSLFDVGHAHRSGAVEAYVRNRNGYEVLLDIRLFTDAKQPVDVRVDGKPIDVLFEQMRFLNHDVHQMAIPVPAGAVVEMKSR